MNSQLQQIESSATPASSKVPRFYYGWVMVVVAALSMLATLPGRTHGLGMITEPLLDDYMLGLTRDSFAHINLAATLLGAFFCIGIGGFVDRVGVRKVLPAVLLLLGATVVGMSLVENIVSFFIAVTLTRGFGQSALSVVSISIVGKWFKRRISWAMAAYTILMSVFFMAAFRTIGAYKDMEWRLLWITIGQCILVFAPLAWLVSRDRPEQLGLTMDGLSSDAAVSEPNPSLSGYTLWEALRTPAFWVFSLAISLFAAISSGIGFFNQSILEDRGFDRDVYFQSLTIGAGVGLLSNFVAGWWSSRWSFHRLTALALVILAGTLVFLTRLHVFTDVVVYVCFSAFAGGMITVIFFAVWPALYGRLHLGRIQGVAQMMTVLFSALGPELFAYAKRVDNSYDKAMFGLAAASVVVAVWAWFVRMPAKPEVGTAPALRPSRDSI